MKMLTPKEVQVQYVLKPIEDYPGFSLVFPYWETL